VATAAPKELSVADDRIDLYEMFREEYAAPREPRLIRCLKSTFLTIAGTGSAHAESFRDRMRVLYGVAHALRTAKKEAGQDFKICRVETLWWGQKEGEDFSLEPELSWKWKLLLRVPYIVRERDRLSIVLEKIENGADPALYNAVDLEVIREGLCVQMLHEGPFKSERETLEKMKAFTDKEGLSLHGALHEIYLSDPQRKSEDPRRTILRIPVR
jgi:hypothetical protein